MRKIHRAALLVVCWVTVGCGRSPGNDVTQRFAQEAAARKDYFGFVVRVETPLEASLARFQAAAPRANDPALKESARETLAQARRAREVVENSRVFPPIAYARGEELMFLNHLVLGFQRYLEVGGGPAELEQLRSILRRGRAHQKRGRAAMAPLR